MNTGTDNSSAFIRDVDPRLFYLEAEKYPLISLIFTQGTDLERKGTDGYTLTGKNSFKQAPTMNPLFEHTESANGQFAFNPNAAVAAADATMTVTALVSAFFAAGDEILLVNSSGQREIARVTIVASTTLTITRNIGSTGAIVMTTADFFYRIGNVRAEDSTSATAVQIKGSTITNYVQFLSEAFGLSSIEMATGNYHTKDPYKQKRMEALSRFKRNLEMVCWFGVKSMDSSTTNPVYHSGGILYWLEQVFTDVPVTDAGGLLTKSAWDQWLTDVMKNGNRQKTVFCSSPVLTAVNGFATNQLRPADVNLKKFGMQITSYQGTHGVVNMVYEPLFDEITSMNGAAVCLDMDNISWRYLSANGVNLNIMAQDDIQENDRSGRKGQWLAVGGIQTAIGKTHGILRNVQN